MDLKPDRLADICFRLTKVLVDGSTPVQEIGIIRSNRYSSVEVLEDGLIDYIRRGGLLKGKANGFHPENRIRNLKKASIPMDPTHLTD